MIGSFPLDAATDSDPNGAGGRSLRGRRRNSAATLHPKKRGAGAGRRWSFIDVLRGVALTGILLVNPRDITALGLRRLELGGAPVVDPVREALYLTVQTRRVSIFRALFLTEALRQESGPDLRVTLVSPDFTNTEGIGKGMDDGAGAAMRQQRDETTSPPAAIAAAIGLAIAQPAGVDISEIVVRPTIRG